MKLVRISHDRCGEFDCAEYLFAPAVYDEDEMHRIIATVSKELIADAEKLAASKDESVPKAIYHPPYDEFPDKTVAEVKQIFAERKAARKAWEDDNRWLARTFEDRMREHGFVPLWEHDEMPELSVSWGHHHGLTLNYGPRRSDA